MKTIKKDELFHNLAGFLKSKGIEFSDGSYSARIQKSCNLLSDAINATQKTVSRTKVRVDHALDKLRQTIHERTAPRPPAARTTAAPSASAQPPPGQSPKAAKPRAKRPSPDAKPRRKK